MIYTIIFFTHSGAIKFNRKMKAQDIPCELMPVPRRLSSNCGIGASIHYDGDHTYFIDEEVEKIYQVDDNNEILVYEQE